MFSQTMCAIIDYLWLTLGFGDVNGMDSAFGQLSWNVMNVRHSQEEQEV